MYLVYASTTIPSYSTAVSPKIFCSASCLAKRTHYLCWRTMCSNRLWASNYNMLLASKAGRSRWKISRQSLWWVIPSLLLMKIKPEEIKLAISSRIVPHGPRLQILAFCNLPHSWHAWSRMILFWTNMHTLDWLHQRPWSSLATCSITWAGI